MFRRGNDYIARMKDAVDRNHPADLADILYELHYRLAGFPLPDEEMALLCVNTHKLLGFGSYEFEQTVGTSNVKIHMARELVAVHAEKDGNELYPRLWVTDLTETKRAARIFRILIEEEVGASDESKG